MIMQYIFKYYQNDKYGLAVKTDNFALFTKLQGEINKAINWDDSSTGTTDITAQTDLNIQLEAKEWLWVLFYTIF